MSLPDAEKRVVYLRDAKAFPIIERDTMQFREAVETAIAQHQPGESPVIIGDWPSAHRHRRHSRCLADRDEVDLSGL